MSKHFSGHMEGGLSKVVVRTTAGMVKPLTALRLGLSDIRQRNRAGRGEGTADALLRRYCILAIFRNVLCYQRKGLSTQIRTLGGWFSWP